MTVPVIGTVCLAIVLLAIVIEVRRLRRVKTRRRRPSQPRRIQLLETRMLEHFAGPRKQYGEIFASFAVWKQDRETQMEVTSSPLGLRLNAFTRALIARHLWRALHAIIGGTVTVVVDESEGESVTWTEKVNAAFDDRGIDPWAPQRARGTLQSDVPVFESQPRER